MCVCGGGGGGGRGKGGGRGERMWVKNKQVLERIKDSLTDYDFIMLHD